jgi:hypothetical protein
MTTHELVAFDREHALYAPKPGAAKTVINRARSATSEIC